jgi:dolichyl-phosphate beta-glucosyltransferase
MSRELSIVIPTYNEKKRIGKTLNELSDYIKNEKLDAEVLIIDAGSPDGTADEVKKYSSKFKDLKIINAGPKPKGKFIKGKQVKKGMLQAEGKYVLFMDADLATPLKYIKSALSQLQSGSQVSICIRNLQKSHKGLRKLISSTGNFLVQGLLLPGISDTQCGFKAFTNEAVKAVFPLQTIDGWGFDMEILAIARKNGYSIGLVEVPDWSDVKEGSKITGSSPIKASIQTFSDLLKIKWRSISGKYKAKK